MKRIVGFLALLVLMLSLPVKVGAIIFINEKAPGVHKEIDRKTGKEVWKSSTGDFLGNVEDSLPITDLDKYNYAYDSKDQTIDGYHNVIVDPEKNGTKKVWDNDRKCYVWRDQTGNYLGRVPDFPPEEQWIMDEMKAIWNCASLTPKAAERYEKQLRKMLKQADDECDDIDAPVESEYSDEEIERMISGAESDMDEASAAIDQALGALHELGMGDYDGLLKNAKGELNKGKNATKNRPKK
ncbi:MAG: hypothetical protein J6U03_03405 [Muribaculaceae bacterium]|nr:hypothetical protein [Muribaculaceae bacterium]